MEAVSVILKADRFHWHILTLVHAHVSVHAHMWPTGLQTMPCVLGFCVCNLLPVNVMLLYMLDSCSFNKTSCVEAAFSRCSSSMISGWLANLQPFCLSSATSLRIMSESIDGWIKSLWCIVKITGCKFNLCIESLNVICKIWIWSNTIDLTVFNIDWRAPSHTFVTFKHVIHHPNC